MKLSFTTLVCICIFAGSMNAQREATAPKLSASTQYYLWQLRKNQLNSKLVMPEFVYRMDAQNKVYVSAMIAVQQGFNGSSLLALGAHVGTKAGNIWTVQVPLNQVQAFTQLKGISYIDMDQPSAPSLDSARKTTRVDSVHMGYNLPQVYNGNNVVVGIVDAGFDYTHPTFYDTAYSAYRIQRVWEEKTMGTPPAGFSYGNEYNSSSAIIAKAHDVTTIIHGTHVGGIAAGSGSGGPGGNSSRFRGMAYKSDIVMVGIYPTAAYWLNTGMSDMLDGMNYVFSYAGSVGKPAVTNLSWGCPLGPHDGSSLFSQACDNLTGPGKIFVLSAGNNGTNNIHLQKTFTSIDTSVSTISTFPSGTILKKNWVDVWGEPGKTFCMEFNLYYGNNPIANSAKICLDNTTHQVFLKGSNGDTCFVTVTTVASEFNGKPHMLIQLYNRTPATNRLLVTIKGTSGTVNMWQGYVEGAEGYYGAFTAGGLAFAVNGDSQMTISDMATSRSAIAVGAYSSKTTFLNVSGQSLSYTGFPIGDIASFSSKGPTVDGRTKPNITGPGMALASAINSSNPDYMSGGTSYSDVVSTYTSPLNGNVYSYAMAAGTSMSGPAVSGIVALLLEANPALSPALVMNILYQTAIVDSHTGVIPTGGSNVWGYGKVNAYRAILKTLQTVGIYHEDLASNYVLFPNPGKDHYTLQYTSLCDETLQLSVCDAYGRELIHRAWQVKQGVNACAIDLDQYATGIYFTNIISASGKGTVKIVKQ